MLKVNPQQIQGLLTAAEAAEAAFKAIRPRLYPVLGGTFATYVDRDVQPDFQDEQLMSRFEFDFEE